MGCQGEAQGQPDTMQEGIAVRGTAGAGGACRRARQGRCGVVAPLDAAAAAWAHCDGS